MTDKPRTDDPHQQARPATKPDGLTDLPFSLTGERAHADATRDALLSVKLEPGIEPRRADLVEG